MHVKQRLEYTMISAAIPLALFGLSLYLLPFMIWRGIPQREKVI